MRLCAVTLAALAACCLMAPKASAQSGDDLQQRVDALAQQLHLRYRQDEAARAEQREVAQSAVVRWNGAAPTPGNRAMMDHWLGLAIRSVMPGGSGRLPRLPEFETPEVVAATDPPSVQEAVDGPAMPEPTIAREPVAEPKPAAPRRPQAVARSRSAAPRREAAKPVLPAADRPSQPVERSRWSRHPAAAPLEWRDPFQADPQASVNPLRTGERRTALRPVFADQEEVRVNLTQLRAGIRGYNVALRDLQGAMLASHDADLATLARAADELVRLDEQRRFLALYREGLSAKRKKALPESPSAELVRELIRRKAEELIRQTPPERRAERQELRRLSERLARLEGDAPAGY